jgi:hypothetical protein
MLQYQIHYQLQCLNQYFPLLLQHAMPGVVLSTVAPLTCVLFTCVVVR